MPRDVFISHSAKDAEKAAEICKLLEKRGTTCWIAPRDVVPGSNFAEAIIEAIEETCATILVLTEHANESIHVGHEVERAVSKAKPIFPIRLREVWPSKALELFISSAQWIDAWSSPLDDQMAHLAQVIASLRKRTPSEVVGSRGLQTRAPRRRVLSSLSWAALAVAILALAAGLAWALMIKHQPEHGTLSLALTPPDAAVLVDGVRVAQPSSIDLPVGTHTIDIRAQGYDANQQVVSLTPGQHETVVVRLNPVQHEQPPTTAAPAAAPTPAAGHRARIARAQDSPDDREMEDMQRQLNAGVMAKPFFVERR